MAARRISIDRLLNKKPPEILYHYTTQDGLLGILNKRQLWATKIQYLNDTTEFSLTVDIAKEKLASRKDKDDNKNVLPMLKYITDQLDNISQVNLCATSFCENFDLLSQWRGYSGRGGGVAIGFRSDTLKRLGVMEGGRLGPCIYARDVQANIIECLINNSITNFKKAGRHYFDYRGPTEYFQRRLIEFGAFFKDIGFHEEREWRLVTGIKRYPDPAFQFRVGRSMLTPYFEIELCRDSQGVLQREYWKDIISSITIGPCPYPGASEQALKGMFIKHGIYDPSASSLVIRHSKVPFRNW